MKTNSTKKSTSELQSNPEFERKNKKSVSETGHAKNVANFQDLISFCEGHGAIYNPSKESLKIPQLKALYQEALDKLTEAKNQKITFDNATNERRNAFSDLKPLSTRVINSFAVSGADTLAIADVKGINKKLQDGTSKKSTPTETIIEEGITNKNISTSQQSYDRQIDNFANLVQLLELHNIYEPNEIDLKTNSLQSKLADLQSKNTALINAYTQYSNAMINRNQKLYNPLTGLIQTSKEVKQYIKSVFGANSPQFKQISDLEFKIVKKD